MAEDSHVIPLAPPQTYLRSDAESIITKPRNSPQKRSSKCFVIILSFIVLQSIVLLVFGSVVLRINSPRVKVEVVEIKNLHYTTASFPSLNMTVVTGITIKNNNYGSFMFKNSSTSVIYGNTIIGSRKISSGRVKARGSRRINVTVQVMAKGFEENRDLSNEIGSGIVKLRSYAKLRGEIRILKKIIRHRTAIMNCTMSLKLSSQEIQDLLCM